MVVMKRFSGILLAILLMLNVSIGIGEEFSIRNGIMFGMDAETVIRLEEEVGCISEKGLQDINGCYSLTFKDNVKIGDVICYTLTYDFDKENKELYEIRYGLDDAYSYLREALVNKYGKAEKEDNTGAMTHIGETFAWHGTAVKKDIHWCIKYDTYDVEIDLLQTKLNVTKLIYHIYPHTETDSLSFGI